MGWGTYLHTDLYFSRKTFNYKHEVEIELEDIKTTIADLEGDLKSLIAMTEPQKFCGEDDPMYWIKRRTDEILEELKDNYIDLYLYELLLDRWDEAHNENGLANDLPEILKYPNPGSFVHGDFVKSVSDPDTTI